VSERVPFERWRNGHFITIPVRVGGSVPTRFGLDTGIGVTIVSRDLCERLRVVPTGETRSGRRMSGQTVRIDLARLPCLDVGAFHKENVVIGVVDLAGFFPEDSGIEGILAPQFFEPWPFAINSVTRTVRIERGEADPPRPAVAVEAPLKVVREGPSAELFLDLVLPSGRTIAVEVDTGSEDLILHSRYMEELGVSPDRANVTKREGRDETGNPYVRYFTQIQGRVSVAAAPSIGQRDPRVMFQEIIYDGLVGDTFLRSYDVTYDLDRGRMYFADPG
jgi:hypothetical protein